MTVPSLKTLPLSETNPFNYWKVDTLRDAAGNELPLIPRSGLKPPIEIQTAAGMRNEDYNNQDFIVVPISGSGTEYVAARATHMLIPAFRIVHGSEFASICRPRRFAPTQDLVVAQAWQREPPMD